MRFQRIIPSGQRTSLGDALNPIVSGTLRIADAADKHPSTPTIHVALPATTAQQGNVSVRSADQRSHVGP